MQKNLYLILISFFLTSCYTYQVKKQVDPTTGNKQESKKNTALANTNSPQMQSTAVSNPQNQNIQQPPVPVNVQENLRPVKMLKLTLNAEVIK